jgi:catechol 2,3-dioxygenase-like lactoylglutathione lyase family enzyme
MLTLTKNMQMKFNYHHMNLCTEDVPRLSEFYQSIFGLSRLQDEEHGLVGAETANRYDGQVDFLTDGQVEFHITKKDNETAFRMKQWINPIQKGHFCFRTDDIEGFKKNWKNQLFLTLIMVNGHWQAGIKYFFTTRMATSSKCIR